MMKFDFSFKEGWRGEEERGMGEWTCPSSISGSLDVVLQSVSPLWAAAAVQNLRSMFSKFMWH